MSNEQNENEAVIVRYHTAAVDKGWAKTLEYGGPLFVKNNRQRKNKTNKKRKRGKRHHLTVTSVKALGYDIVVTRQMRPAIAASVHVRTVEVYHRIVIVQCPPGQFALMTTTSPDLVVCCW